MNVFRKKLITGLMILVCFTLWTAGVCTIDVQPIGPQQSQVGFAAFNTWVHQAIGVHMNLYVITDWLGLVPVGITLGFAILGLCQWICRRNLLRVDFDILMLGLFDLIVFSLFLFFEEVEINYRPVLIQGFLEASYPSSTTLLVLCILPTTIIQCKKRVHNHGLRMILQTLLGAFAVFMVAGRLISGVHWCSDIVGGILCSAGLVYLYSALCELEPRRE